MDAPSMVQRSGDTLIVRSVVSGNQLYLDQEADQIEEARSRAAAAAAANVQPLLLRSQHHLLQHHNQQQHHQHNPLQAFHQQSLQHSPRQPNGGATSASVDPPSDHSAASAFDSAAAADAGQQTDDDIDLAGSSTNLPQCKIKRNYSCNSCTYFTQNPRHFLTHLKEVHGEKIVINACRHCLYASRHYQKLVRHMKMVHGSTDGLEEQALSRKRASQLAREQKKRKCSTTLDDLQQQQQQQQQQHHQQLQQHSNLGQHQQQHHHQIQLQIQRQYQQQMEQHHQQIMQQQHRQLSAAAASRRPNTPDPADPSGMLLMDTQSIDGSCSSSPEPPEPIVTLLDTSGGDESPVPPGSVSGIGSLCGDQSDNSKQLKCTLCEFSTYWRSLLVEHERVEHKLTQFYRCAKCSYVTHIKARYSKHVKYHSMPMIKCEMCDFRTPYKWNLDRHMKNHGGAGLYKCSACNFTADIKQSLTVHEMNHHVPPVGHASGMSMARRRNKVGGTDIADGAEYGGVSIHLAEMGGGGERRSFDSEMMLGSPGLNNNNNSCSSNNNNNSGLGSYNELMHHHQPPLPMLNHIKLEAPADLSMKRPALDVNRKPSRPVPNLIPIVGQQPGDASPTHQLQDPSSPAAAAAAASAAAAAAAAAAMNFSLGGRNLLATLAAAMSQQKDGNDATTAAAIQDLAALLIQSQAAGAAAAAATATAAANPTANDSSAVPETINLSQMSPLSSSASSSSATSVTGRRKPSANFFEEMKQKLASNAGGNVSTLVCPCGHVAKCLSERIIHQKQCTYRRAASPARADAAAGQQTTGGALPVNLCVAAGTTRCPHCRHRCKSSTDLFVHLQNCAEARTTCSTSNGESIGSSSNFGGSMEKIDGSMEDAGIDEEVDDVEDEEESDVGGGDETDDDASRKHPMENRVFVWNNMQSPSGADGHLDAGKSAAGATGGADSVAKSSEKRSSSSSQRALLDRSDSSVEHEGTIRFYGVETAPGYGEVTQKPPTTGSASAADDDQASASLKKVFKCPHCSFWASTASRFHVHIVGHLNKKPFECSLCSYRSNWRWDITKHIRLKTIRDPSHKNARVLMNDETGRRNYTKYNKHITLMKVTEEDGDPKLLKSGEMTPSQEAALSFLGQSSSDSTQPGFGGGTAGNGAHANTSGGGGGAGRGGATSSEDGFDSCDGPLSLVKIGAGQQPQQVQMHQPLVMTVMPALIPTGPAGGNAHNGNGGGGGAMPTRTPTAEAESKKTSFKCKKCNFRHSNRDVVLTHVKGHYHDAGIMLDPKPPAATATTAAVQSPTVAPEPPIIAPTALLRLPLPLALPVLPDRNAAVSIHLQPVPAASQPPPSSSSSLEPQTPPQMHATDMSMSPSTTIVTGSPAAASAAASTPSLGSGWSPIVLPLAVPSAQTASAAATTVTSVADVVAAAALGNSPSGHANVAPSGNNANGINTIENGEMDEASSLGSSVHGWRDPAPYRCGHCHQVSNWKHVIQRHCRLKHNGDINIEFIEKGNRHGAYARLFIPGITTTTPTSSSSTDAAPPSHGDQQPPAAPEPETTTTTVPSTSPMCAPPQPQQNQLIQLLNQKPKHFACPHCFYSSPCRSQLDGHLKAAHPDAARQQPSAFGNGEVIELDDNDDGITASENNTTSAATDLDELISSTHLPTQRNGPTSTTTISTADQQLAHIQALRSRNSFATSPIQIAEYPSNIEEMVRRSAVAAAADDSAADDYDDHDMTDDGRGANGAAPPAEKCPHCPFETGHAGALAEHMQHHICMSAAEQAHTCDHCDFSVGDVRTLRRHVRLHFGGLGGEGEPEVRMGERRASGRLRRAGAPVRYYTRYDGLVLSSSTMSPERTVPRRRRSAAVRTSEQRDACGDVDDASGERTQVIFPLACDRKSVESATSGGSDKENKIIVDIGTGEVL